jgi:predicted KAP-like P-loop ATPase
MPVHPDSPITVQAEDLLGRWDYAGTIADSIARYTPTDSVVLGLEGPWGSGKSSLINLILQRLPEEPNPRPIVVHFNPWRYSGSDYLLASFFTTLSKAIGAFDNVDALRNASKKMREASRALALFKMIPHAGGYFGRFSTFFQSASEKVEGLISDAGSLDNLHKVLATELSAAQRRILVVIDDVDRLEPSEIRQIFQLVKSLADFPYVMYLVAYDESVVLRAIDSDGSVARNYLEKIISLPLRVPPISRDVLDNMVLGNITEMLRPALPTYYNEERFFGQYVNGFRAYLSTMRHVRRFLNSFEFIYGRAKNELDIGDLATLTALEVFDPSLRDLIYAESDAFIDNTMTTFRGDRDHPVENRERIEALLTRAETHHRAVATDTLRQLFHKVDLEYKNRAYNFSDEQETHERRITSSDYFPRYFNVGAGPSQLSQTEYAEAFRVSTEDNANFVDLIETLGDSKAANFIDQIQDDDRVRQFDNERRSALVRSLFALANRVHVNFGPLSVPFDWQVDFAVDYALDGLRGGQWFDEMRLILSADDTAAGPAVSYIDLIDRLHGQDRARAPDLTDGQVSDLKLSAIAMVRARIRMQTLDSERHLGRLMYCLRQWGEGDFVNEIVAQMRDRPAMLLSFLNSSRQRSAWMPCLRPSSLAGVPASSSLRIATI